MELSYWEYKNWLAQVDYTVVGSGIVGLSCAIRLKQRFPKAKVLVLEQGTLPQGASTKNAGFACFGSLSEILSDLENHTPQEVFRLVEQRYHGIQALRKQVGDRALEFYTHGGHEVFLAKDQQLYERCLENIEGINELLAPIFGAAPFTTSPNIYGFKAMMPSYISHVFEGQLDTGKMMNALLSLAQKVGVLLLNNVTLTAFEDLGARVVLSTNQFSMNTGKLCVATNGFAKQLLSENVAPARAQVLITKPIKDLAIKGCFHLEEGYYYFRNVDERILFGGGRNLDFKAEETTEFSQTALVQNELERLLAEVILPETPFEIDHRWSGIMGVGPQKKPIIKQLSDNVFCGVRLGGMGVAIGSYVGSTLAEKI